MQILKTLLAEFVKKSILSMRVISVQNKIKRKNNVALQQLIPKVRGIPILANIERIIQPVTDFIRGNPIVSTASVGAGVTGLVAAVAITKRAGAAVRKRRKKSKAKKPAKRRRKRGKLSKTELRAMRLRNLKKARSAKKRGSGRRKIIRGRGLGTREIRHSGKSTKGKFKVVSFRNKKTGKMVRFKVRK